MKCSNHLSTYIMDIWTSCLTRKYSWLWINHNFVLYHVPYKYIYINLDYYTPTMLGLKMDQEVLGELVRMKVPAVWQAMNRHNVMWTLVVSRWFICLYIDILPVEVRIKVKGCSLLKEINGKLCSHWTNFSPYEMISQFL